MRERVCRNCGGRKYTVVGQNMVKCMFCGTLYVDEQSSKEEDILTVSAYEKLRMMRFDEATKEFDKIISLYPLSFEAYFGRALARNKIIIYNNKRGARKYPKFFGDKIESIEEDEDVKQAIKNAPPETAAEYNELVKRISKLHESYESLDKGKKYDVFVCAMNYDKNGTDKRIDDAVKRFEENNLSVYFLQADSKKEKEEEVFYALTSADAFVLIANSKKGYSQTEYKNLFDRYYYFITQRKKYSKSFIVALDEEDISATNLPDEISFCKSFVDFNATTFLQDVVSKVKREIEDSVKEVAKIETIKIEKVTPEKKEYLDIDSSIDPVELGHYKVENMETSEENKLRWIFLCLKNSDFATAEKEIKEELQKDENNAELLFAELLCEKKLHTAGEFFSSIGNFTDKEKIDKILQYATKEFAEMFVDNWEKLVISLDSEEYYNAFLTYLAQFYSPMREEFVKCAEQKAIQTQDAMLIDKVLKCFKKDEVDRFAEFYFLLAQHSDNQEYYKKVLEIDIGHEQSNFALLLSRFKTTKDKLTYRNRQEVEDSLKFLGEKTRDQFVGAVVKMTAQVAFIDKKQAEEQIDFYLSYMSDDENIVKLLKKIATILSSMEMFSLAEKYLSIAISKAKDQAELYWLLIQAKMHCKNDMEIISSSIDVAQMAEWGTLLNIANEEQTEKFAGIISKSHLYSGEKQPLQDELIDKVTLQEKLDDFLNRNNKIMLDLQKQGGAENIRGVRYFKSQFVPIENYAESLKKIETFEEYKELYLRLFERLDLMELSLDSSLSVIEVAEKGGGMKGVANSGVDERIRRKQERRERKRAEKGENFEEKDHKRFWRNFLFTLFAIVPNCFGLMFLAFICIDPKLVYTYFSQMVVLGIVVYDVLIGIAVLVVYVAVKRKIGAKWKTAFISVMCLAFVNLIMLAVDFYFINSKIKISSVKELDVMTKNATFSELVLGKDLSFDGAKWKQRDFFGTINGDGHTISDVSLVSKNGCYALFSTNNGTIENLKIVLTSKSYSAVKSLSAIASVNKGKIKNCEVSGHLTINTNASGVIGAFAAENSGVVKNCTTDAIFSIKNKKNIVVGGIVGEVKNKSTIEHNTSNAQISIESTSGKIVYLGGIAGEVAQNDITFERNHANIELVTSGNAAEVVVGGLIGVANAGSENNYAEGLITNTATTDKMIIGGLVGRNEEHSTSSIGIAYSYSIVNMSSSAVAKVGGLVGVNEGNLKNCFTSFGIKYGEEKFANYYTKEIQCGASVMAYETKYGFNKNIWDLSGTYPTLK